MKLVARLASVAPLAAVLLVACGGGTTEGTPPSDGGADAGDSSAPSTTDATADATTDASVDGSGSDGDDGGAGEDAEADGDVDGGLDAAAPDAAFCNPLANAAPVIPYVNVAGPLPMGQGGALSPGTYYIEAANVYSADGGAGVSGTVQSTLVLSGGPTTFGYQIALSAGFVHNDGAGTMTISGTTLSNQDACNGGGGGNPYSTDVTDAGVVELRLLNPLTSDSVIEYVMQRQ